MRMPTDKRTMRIITPIVAAVALAFAGAANAADHIESQGAHNIAKPKAPQVLAQGGGYTAKPNLSRRVRPNTCVRFRMRVTDKAITTASGFQLARRGQSFHNVVNGSMGARVATWRGQTVCNTGDAVLWAHGWR